MPTSSIRILIAEDHPIVSEGLTLLLEKKYTVIGVVTNGRALVSEALKSKPDLVVVDIGMPLLNGLDAARLLREQLPSVKLVFLTMQDNSNLAAAALQLGPVGFVIKQSAGSELLKAIDQVLSGKNYVTPKLRPNDWVETKERASQYSKELNPHQREMVQLFAEGRSLKEVAWLLGVSRKTVEFHKYRIMHWLNLQTTSDLVLFALQQGLISPKSSCIQQKSEPHRKSA